MSVRNQSEEQAPPAGTEHAENDDHSTVQIPPQGTGNEEVGYTLHPRYVPHIYIPVSYTHRGSLAISGARGCSETPVKKEGSAEGC